MSISTQLNTPVSTSGTSSRTNGQRRNGHRHKRSFAMSGDFDFLKPELSAMGSAKSVTGSTESTDVVLGHGSRRNSRFFLSSGEETTFDEQNVPDAMIDLDDIVHSFDVKSSISMGNSSGTHSAINININTHRSGRRDRGRNSYGYNNYQIRSKSNIVYSNNNLNNNTNKNGGAPMGRNRPGESGFMHRRSESAPADLDPAGGSHLVFNDTPTTGTTTNVNAISSSNGGGSSGSNGGSSSGSSNNGGDIREEENEDSSNDSSPVKSLEGRPGRFQKTQKQSPGMVLQEGQQKRTYRNTGRQKERYATYNSYISSVSAAIAKNNNNNNNNSTATTTTTTTTRNTARHTQSGDDNTPTSAGNIGLEGRRSPVFYGGQRNSVGSARAGGLKNQPFKFKTTMYDVEDTSCEATAKDKKEVREDHREDHREDDKQEDKQDDKEGSETEHTPPPPLVHTKSHSIAIGEQQNNLLNGNVIPSCILLGEPGDLRDVCALPSEIHQEAGVTTERHASTSSVSSGHTAHTYTSVKKTEASSTLSLPHATQTTQNTQTTQTTQTTQKDTQTETQSSSGRKRRESRSSKIFNSAISLMRSTSSLNLRDAFTTTKDTNPHPDHAATKNKLQTTNDNPNNPDSLSKTNRKTKLRQWLFRK